MSPQRPTAPLVIASNRGPVDFELTENGITTRRGEGGLIAVLGPVLADRDGVWVAAARTEGDRVMARRADAGGVLSLVDLPEGRVAVRGLELDPRDYEAYYSSVGTQILWFLHHHLLDEARPRDDAGFRADWAAYLRVNERFAAACAETAAPGAVVLLQDYHLAVAPAMLRARRPDVRIAHFTMCPWAEPQRFRQLPAGAARALVEGMLGADVVAFLANRWADSFLRCCAELGLEVDHRTRRVRHPAGEAAVRVYRVGVDVAALRDRCGHPRVRLAARELDALVGDCRLVARVERMEPAKNAVRGITGFGEFLAAHPEQAGRVVHHVIAYTSRAGLDSYRRYARQVQAAARAVNRRFGTPAWTPVRVETVNDFDRGIALMARADVLVVNPVRDGMNLVAKECAAVNDRDAAVILSRETGAAEELGGAALLVDPFDTAQLADTIATALAMPRSDRRRRLQALRAGAMALPPRRWLATVLVDLSTLAPAATSP
ncbi:MAG TPA: trehalose-6-phosphate synthase [Micromonosporaceae bacterium]|nr:trehalose-6-phosphate synthase [Micromonosporaceae bacterium]